MTPTTGIQSERRMALRRLPAPTAVDACARAVDHHADDIYAERPVAVVCLDTGRMLAPRAIWQWTLVDDGSIAR